MSLINDMLNDLDQRRSHQHQHHDEVALDFMSGHKAGHRKNTWVMPVLVLLIIILLLVIAYSLWRVIVLDASPALSQLLDRNAGLVAVNDEVIVGKSKIVEQQSQIITNKDSVVDSHAVALELKLQPKESPTQVTTEPVVVANKERKVDPVIKAEKALIKKSKSDLIRVSRPLTVAQQDSQQSKKSQQLLRDGDILAAEKSLQTFLQQYPQASRSSELLAMIFLQQQRLVEVESLLAVLANYNVRSVGLSAVDARLMLAKGEPALAVSKLMGHKPAVASNIDYYELLAFAARQNKQYQLSSKVYQGLLDFDATNGNWWVGMAIALDMQKKNPAAREAYRQALELRKISPALRSYAQQRLGAS